MKCPRTPTFTLKGIEAKIQLLQVSIAEDLSWLEHSFGTSVPHTKEIKPGEVEIYPVVYVDNTTDVQDVRPNDNFKSMAFWEYADPGRTEYDNQDIYAAVKSARWEYDVSLLIWANLERIDDSAYNEVKSQMRQDILDALQKQLIGKNVMFTAGEINDKDIDKVFLGYDLQNKYNIMKWPYVAFRINGIITFKSECPVSNSYSRTTCS